MKNVNDLRTRSLTLVGGFRNSFGSWAGLDSLACSIWPVGHQLMITLVWFTPLYLFGPRSFFIHSLCENHKVRFDSLCVEPCFSGVSEGDHCSTGVGRMVLKKTTYLVVCSVIMTVKVILLLI